MTDKQQEVRDFLEKATKDKGFSLNALSLQLGKNPTYLFHFIKRHSPRRLDEQTRRKLSQILDVAEQKLCDYPLMGGLIQDKLSTISGLLGIGRNKSESDMTEIKVLDMEGQKKGDFSDIMNNVIGSQYLSLEMLQFYGFSDISNIKIIKVSGDAMSPIINNGDLIWLDMSYNKPCSDGIYLINANHTVLLRRIQINPFDDSWELSADNKAYKTFVIGKNERIDICGKVLLTTKKL